MSQRLNTKADLQAQAILLEVTAQKITNVSKSVWLWKTTSTELDTGNVIPSWAVMVRFLSGRFEIVSVKSDKQHALDLAHELNKMIDAGMTPDDTAKRYWFYGGRLTLASTRPRNVRPVKQQTNSAAGYARR